jgi:hypothetical protein
VEEFLREPLEPDDRARRELASGFCDVSVLEQVAQVRRSLEASFALLVLGSVDFGAGSPALE